MMTPRIVTAEPAMIFSVVSYRSIGFAGSAVTILGVIIGVVTTYMTGAST
jgi:hypothetical protein